MDKRKVARELVKLAKELVGVERQAALVKDVEKLRKKEMFWKIIEALGRVAYIEANRLSKQDIDGADEMYELSKIIDSFKSKVVAIEQKVLDKMPLIP